MLFSPVVFALLSGSAWLAAAAPKSPRPAAGLRLIKTFPEDRGRWVTEEQKIRDFKSKSIGFVDITDITDAEVLAALSSADTEETGSFAVQAVTYPSSVSHQTEANALLAQVSTTNPQSWLKTLTECVLLVLTPSMHRVGV